MKEATFNTQLEWEKNVQESDYKEYFTLLSEMRENLNEDHASKGPCFHNIYYLNYVFHHNLQLRR